MSEHKENPEAVKLRKDVNVGAIYRFLIILGVVCLLAMVAVWGVFLLFNKEARATDPQVSPLATKPDSLPPDPRLQTNESADLQKVLTEQNAGLKGYGWVDKNKGIVHIPIDLAIKIVAGNKSLQDTAAPGPQEPMAQSQPAQTQPEQTQP